MRPWIRTSGRRVRGALLGLAALAGLCCSDQTATPPNVLMIVVDTLRQDHLGCYGYSRDITPSIDALAASGLRFDRAYATAPWTMPSVASMITGLYPGSHGLTRTTRLPAEAVTVAEILGEHGYATAGVVSHVLLGSVFGFDQGYEVYEQTVREKPHKAVTTEAVTDKAQSLLRQLAEDDRPFFLFVHYFDPHYEYQRHPEIGLAPERAGRLDGTQTIHELRALLGDITDEEVEFVRDLYDEEIAHTDAGIGRLLATLRETGQDPNTLILFVADHGEEFVEHGWIGHTRTLYEELVRVPLIVRPPQARARAGATDRLVSLASLTPTILDYCGIETEELGFQAPSLAALVDSGLAEGLPAAYAEVEYVPLKKSSAVKITFKKALATASYKVVRDDLSGRVEVFDLVKDPGERHDLADSRPDLVARLLPELEQAIARSRERALDPEEAQIDEELIERLRSLGYVGK